MKPLRARGKESPGQLVTAGALVHRFRSKLSVTYSKMKSMRTEITCACGCGQQTNTYRSMNKRLGQVKGLPQQWIKGHDKRKYPRDARCRVDGCGREIEASHLCHSHFAAWKRNPSATLKPYVQLTTEQRFLEKVIKLSSGHWIWSGATASEGRYGAFQFEGRVQPAHRAAWIMWRGQIPEGLVVDHRCRKTLCVNPDHLEPKTQKENILIGEAPTALNAAKTHCLRGHAYSPENTYIIPSSGGRACIACARSEEGRASSRDRTRRYRERQRALSAM